MHQTLTTPPVASQEAKKRRLRRRRYIVFGSIGLVLLLNLFERHIYELHIAVAEFAGILLPAGQLAFCISNAHDAGQALQINHYRFRPELLKVEAPRCAFNAATMTVKD